MQEKQQEWASLKYLILSKSQEDYKAIRKLFANNKWDQEKEQLFRFYIHHALSEPASRGNCLNAYQHVWGYFKEQATAQEKAKYQELVTHFSIEEDELLPFLRALTLKYKEAYLLQSKLLFDKK